MHTPDLSICIPTYNRLKYVKKQLNFLLGEYTPRIEIIVSDNGSTDGTQEYLRMLSSTETRVKCLINAENIGSEGNMYRCVSIARGEYIFFLGDDDYLVTGFVNYALQLITNNNSIFYHFNYTAFDEDNLMISYKKGIDKPLCIKNKRLSSREISRLVAEHYGAFLFISSNIFKREIVVNLQNGCTNWVETLRLSILSMNSGLAYIDNESKVLCGVNSSWTDRRGDVWFDSFPKMFDTLENFGFSKKEIKYMKDCQLAGCIFNYLRNNFNKYSKKNWNNTILQLININILLRLGQLYIIRGFNKIINVILDNKQVIPISDTQKVTFRIE